MRSLLLLLLALALPTPASAQSIFAPRNQSQNAEELYLRGLRHMRSGYYTKALESFQRVRNYHRDDPVSVKAELAIADVFFKKGEYDQARLAYEDFARLHPRHADLDYVIFRTGLSIYKRASRIAGRDQTSTRQAVNIWTGFDRRFSDSEHLDEVQQRLGECRNRLARKELIIARFYARRKSWGATQGRLEGLLTYYSDTSVVPASLALLGTSYHAWGQVDEANAVRARLEAEYPGTPALVKLDRTLARTPGTLPDSDQPVRPYRYPGMGAAPGSPMGM